jgi:hypothetical protein
MSLGHAGVARVLAAIDKRVESIARSGLVAAYENSFSADDSFIGDSPL